MTDHDRNRIRRIFFEVVELPPLQRAAALDRLCAGNASLRAQVERLLTADADAAGFMARPTGAGMDIIQSELPTASIAPITEKPGEIIGPYKLLQVIGEGGFGTVFMAEQQRPVVRKVALKIIKLGMDTRQVVARFEQERQALALMDHPNIAKVFDGGATDSGRPYFVMELVRGVPITEYADANNLTARERLELFIPVCHAVQHAHHKGVIHRDIKPSNILVTLHDGKPVPKVIDFGVAKATQSRLTEKTLFTEHKQFIGTPAYMAPEQAELSGLDIDTRADVYALGVLLYELLTGTTPFDARLLLEAGYAEMQRIIREVEPPKPSTRVATLAAEAATTTATKRRVEPARFAPLLRGDLDWMVMKALEKDRTRRYDTPVDFLQDVERHLAGEPVVAAPPSAAYRVRKFVRRNKARVVAVVAITLALLLGLVGTSAMYKVAESRLEELKDARVTLGRFQDTRAIEWGKLVSESMVRTPDPLADLRRAVESCRRILGPFSVETGEMILALTHAMGSARTEEYRGLAREASGIFELALSERRAAGTPSDLSEADLILQLEVALYRLGDEARRERYVRQRLQVARELREDEARFREHQALLSLLEILLMQGRFAEADPMSLDYVLLTEALPDLRSWRSEALTVRAFVLNELGQIDGALTSLNLAEEINRHFGGSFSNEMQGQGVSNTDAMLRLRILLCRETKSACGEIELPEKLVSRGSVVDKSELDNDEDVTRGFYGIIFSRVGRDADAESQLRRVLDIRNLSREAGTWPDYTAVLWPDIEALGELGMLYLRSGREAEAEQSFRKAVTLTDRAMQNTDPADYDWSDVYYVKYEALASIGILGVPYAGLGAVLLRQGCYEEAEPYLLYAYRCMSDPAARYRVDSPRTLEQVRADLVSLYERWDAAEPGRNLMAKAQEWRE